MRFHENIVADKRESNYDSILWHAQEQLRMARIVADSVEIGRAYLSLSYAYQNLEVFEKEVEFIIKAKLAFRNKSDEWLAKAVYELAWLYVDVDFTLYDLPLFLKYSESQFKASGNTEWLIKVYKLYGYYFLFNRTSLKKDSALHYFNKAITLCKTGQFFNEYYKILVAKSSYYSKKEHMDLDSSLYFSEEILKYRFSSKTIVALASLNRVQALALKGDYPEYHEDLINVFKLCQNIRPKSLESFAAYLAYEYHLSQKRYDSALFYNTINKDYLIKNAKRGKDYLNLISSLQMKENDLIFQEKETAKAKQSQQQLLLIMALVVISMLIVIVTIILKKNRDFRRLNSELRDKNEQVETLLREIHHRVKNNLQMVVALLDLQGESIKDEHVRLVLNEAGNRIKSIAFIHQKLYRGDNKKISIGFRKYIEELCDNLLYSYDMSGKVKVTMNIDEMYTSFDKAVILGLLVNEIISNALKHAFKGNRTDNQLHVSIRREQSENVTITIKDNGVGLQKDFNSKSESFGVDMIQTFTKDLNGVVEFENKKGTTVTIRLKNFESEPA